jgi:ankyrin repeat protein
MASARDPRLEAAVQRGDANRVRAALGVGADKIHAVNQYGSPIIHMASSLGKEAAIEVLIQRGANLDDANSVGWTAMMLAARDGHPGALRLLLEANADPTLRDREGRSALDWALASAHSDNSECTTLLQNAVVPAGLCMTPFSGMSMKYDTRQMVRMTYPSPSTGPPASWCHD